jgi:hypothetical protein
MTYLAHTVVGLALIGGALCALRQARELRHLRNSNAERMRSESAGERAARRTC